MSAGSGEFYATPVTVRASDAGPSTARTLLAAGLVLGGAAGLGVLGGWLWWQWWAPGPDGAVFALRDGGTTWVPQPAESGYDTLFEATPQYAVLGIGLGLVLGVLAGLLCRRRALVGLAAAGIGSVIGAAVMYLVGTSQSPPDPTSLLDGAEVGDVLPGALDITGWTPYLGWPVGALVGFVVVLLLVIDRSAPPRHR